MPGFLCLFKSHLDMWSPTRIDSYYKDNIQTGTVHNIGIQQTFKFQTINIQTGTVHNTGIRKTFKFQTLKCVLGKLSKLLGPSLLYNLIILILGQPPWLP